MATRRIPFELTRCHALWGNSLPLLKAWNIQEKCLPIKTVTQVVRKIHGSGEKSFITGSGVYLHNQDNDRIPINILCLPACLNKSFSLIKGNGMMVPLDNS